jgi:outer membrane protein assembly factor BamB
MLKKLIIPFLAFLSVCSCSPNLNSPLALGEEFPLVQAFAIPHNGEIRGIAVSDDWFAYHTLDAITAIDIGSQKTLWQEKFRVISSREGFQIINDRLITISNNQIVSWNKQGQREELIRLDALDSSVNIITIPMTYQNYAYIIRGPQWTLEAYDTSIKRILWKIDGIENAFYDPSSNIAYLITRDGDIQSIDNASGTLLWRHSASVVQGGYSSGIFYLYEKIKSDGHYEISAFDVQSQKELWRINYTNLSESDVYKLAIIDQYLFASVRSGLVAFDKNSGASIWKADIGEPVETSPIEFDGVIYAKGVFSRAIYAISLTDGSIIEALDLEKETLFTTGDIYTGIYKLPNGIVFSGRDAVYNYISK